MAGSLSSGEEEGFSSINITPLVDVVLVLLIIFMITAPAIYQSSIQVQLPKATSGQAASKNPLTFTLNKDGDLHWNQSPQDWKTLGKKLKDLGPNTAEETATITADQATPHGTVIRLMDALREAGLTRFALSVQPQTQ